MMSLACGDPSEAPNDEGAGGASGASGDGGSATGGSGGTGATGTGGQSGWVNSELGFNPSNVDLEGDEASRVGDIVIDGECELATEQGKISCASASSYSHRFVELPGGWRYSVFVMRSLTVESSAVLRTSETVPAVLIALDDMTIRGGIDVRPGTAGGAKNEIALERGAGPGGGPTGSTSVAGGGASFCGRGGLGGAKPGATSGLVKDPYGDEALAPHVGGSAGGTGASLPPAGFGGGAIELVAGGTFTLAAGAFVSAGGGGGLAGEGSSGSAGGGGSGGAIVIEALTVVLEGTLAANGGGGGQGTGSAGEDGRTDSTRASGGANEGGASPGRGGDGSAADETDGLDGNTDDTSNPGGGGGGAGRIRINTGSMAVDLSSLTASPTPASGCTTTGSIF